MAEHRHTAGAPVITGIAVFEGINPAQAQVTFVVAGKTQGAPDDGFIEEQDALVDASLASGLDAGFAGFETIQPEPDGKRQQTQEQQFRKIHRRSIRKTDPSPAFSCPECREKTLLNSNRLESALPQPIFLQALRMLSYRHAFHAGNHADVLKHLMLIQIAQYMAEKPAPFWIIDTHAGAGRYALESEHAKKLGEYRDGIGRLWERKDLPPAAVDYLEMVKLQNPDGALRRYPGSPWIASQLLRESDRLRLYEMHSTDSKFLQECFKGSGRQVAVTVGDGFAGLKALLPPPPRRALVLIDPSYETRDDYSNVVKGLQEALKRFPTGTYAIWYPMLSKPESQKLPNRLKSLGAGDWLHATLEVRAPARDGFGMHGSGMFVINPPWTLEKTLHETLPKITELLSQGPGAKYGLESQTS